MTGIGSFLIRSLLWFLSLCASAKKRPKKQIAHRTREEIARSFARGLPTDVDSKGCQLDGRQDCASCNGFIRRAAPATEYVRSAEEGPVIVSSVVGTEVVSPFEEQAFLRKYGHLWMQFNNGFFDSRRKYITKLLGDYSREPSSNFHVFEKYRGIGDSPRGRSPMISAWRSALPARNLFPDIFGDPFFTLNRFATETRGHEHSETWQLLLAGRKAWWIADPSHDSAVSASAMEDPCRSLGIAPPKGLTFCVQFAGEVIYFPSDAKHATCNLDNWVLGVGAQGSTKEWLPMTRMVARGLPFAKLQSWMRSVGEFDSLDVSEAFNLASGQGATRVLELLVASKASVNQANEQGQTALMAAASRSSTASLKLLLRMRADVTAQSKGGYTAMYYAMRENDLKHMDILYKAMKGILSTAALRRELTSTLLHASQRGASDVVDYLLKVDGSERLPLIDALRTAQEQGHARIVGSLEKILVTGKATEL